MIQVNLLLYTLLFSIFLLSNCVFYILNISIIDIIIIITNSIYYIHIYIYLFPQAFIFTSLSLSLHHYNWLQHSVLVSIRLQSSLLSLLLLYQSKRVSRNTFLVFFHEMNIYFVTNEDPSLMLSEL